MLIAGRDIVRIAVGYEKYVREIRLFFCLCASWRVGPTRRVLRRGGGMSVSGTDRDAARLCKRPHFGHLYGGSFQKKCPRVASIRPKMLATRGHFF
jgi:hypothetical protein